MQVNIVLERRLNKRPNKDVLRERLRKAVDRSLASARGRNWSGVLTKLEEPVQDGENWVYHATICYRSTKEGTQTENKFPEIVSKLSETCASGPFTTNPWTIIQPNEWTASGRRVTSQTTEIIREDDREITKVNLDPGDNFKHIYKRESHIRLILDAVKLAVDTNYSKRVHSLLYGPAGCGKTEIVKALAKTLGTEDEAYIFVDATSMSRAGILEVLMNAPTMPSYLLIEELEKTDEGMLRWLLSLMDTRSEIRRLNYRVGSQQRSARMVVIATANDIHKLKGMMSNALLSRFQNKIYCPPPDRDVMQKILEREIEEIGGDRAWINPVLELFFDEMHIKDPRTIISNCLLGRERLLDGSFQADKKETMSEFDFEELAEYLVDQKKKEKKNGQ